MRFKDLFILILKINWIIGGLIFGVHMWYYITKADNNISILFIIAFFGLYGYVLYNT